MVMEVKEPSADRVEKKLEMDPGPMGLDKLH